jgi:hypothetical protein
MTIPQTWTPSYLRRAPRWHDGVGRLMDIGGTFDLKLPRTPAEVDAEALAEDLLMVRQDLRRALASLRPE